MRGVPAPIGSSLDTLISAISDLRAHIDSTNTLSDDQLQVRANLFENDSELLGTDFTAMNAALELIDAYEDTHGALFINSKTSGGFSREGNDDLTLERTILLVQQAFFDEVFQRQLVDGEESVIENCQYYLNDRAWKTSSFFPGHVDQPNNITVVHSVSINGTVPTYWGKKDNCGFAAEPALRPTGLYLSPGGIAKITVPSALVNKGFEIRVGASKVDHSRKDIQKRMDRVSATFEIESTTVYVY
jgi:hypothetical protein